MNQNKLIIIMIVTILNTAVTGRLLSTDNSTESIKDVKYVFKPAPEDPGFYENLIDNKLKKLYISTFDFYDKTNNDTKSLIETKADILQSIQNEITLLESKHENKLDNDYFNQNPKKISCIEHVKNLGLGYTCMDKGSISIEDKDIIQTEDILGSRFTPIFVVEKKLKKFFLIIFDEAIDLELGIQKHFVHNQMSLELNEYKIINSRYAGIYTYIPHHNTLRYNIKNNNFQIYEKLFVMQSLVNYAIEFFDNFEPRNNLLMLNLLPTNILVTKESFLKLRLMKFIRGTKMEEDVIISPESIDENTKMNQRSTIVFLLGKLFYYILFGVFPESNKIDDDKYMIEYNKFFHLKDFPEINGDLLELIRGMVNKSPMDRQSLEYITNKLDEFLEEQNSFYYTLQKKIAEIKNEMENEIRSEYFEHELFIRKKNKETNIYESKDDSFAIKAEIKNEQYAIESLRKKYLFFIGRSKQCYYQKTKNEINYLDNYGMFMFNAKEIVSVFDLLNEKAIEKIEEHYEIIEEHHEEEGLKIEFIILIIFLLFLISIISSYFILKDHEMVKYLQKDFPAKLILA